MPSDMPQAQGAMIVRRVQVTQATHYIVSIDMCLANSTFQYVFSRQYSSAYACTDMPLHSTDSWNQSLGLSAGAGSLQWM